MTETPTAAAPDPLAAPAKRPHRKIIPPGFGERPPAARRLLYYTANALTQCDTLTEALTEAYAIMRATGSPAVVEAVYEDLDAVAPRLRRERKATVTP